MTSRETTLRLRTQSELQALKEWTLALREARTELDLFTDSKGRWEGDGATGAGSGGGAASGGPPPMPGPASPATPSASGGGPPPAPAPVSGDGGGAGGGGGDTSDGRGGRSRVGAFVTGAAAATLGMSLGGSGIGFLLNAAQTFMELDRSLTALEHRLGSSRGKIVEFGMGMGFARAETSMFVDALSAQTNTAPPAQGMQLLGFTRALGLDPNQVVGGMGRTIRLMGGASPTSGALAGLMGQASIQGMGLGRQAEYYQALQQIVESEFRQTGRVGANWAALGVDAADFQGDLGLQGAMMTMGLAPSIFGRESPKALGMEGLDFTMRLNQGMQSQGPWQSYMMRAMGYGRDPKMDYMTMRERLEAGVTGDMGGQNILDVAKFMRKQGLSQGGIYRGLEGAFGGQLKAHELRALSGWISSGGAEEWAGGSELPSGEDIIAAARAHEIEASGGQVDWTAAGRGAIPKEAAFRTGLENLRMGVGEDMTGILINVQQSVKGLAGAFENLTGIDLLGIADGIESVTGAMSYMAAELEKWSHPFGVRREKQRIEDTQARQRGEVPDTDFIRESIVAGKY